MTAAVQFFSILDINMTCFLKIITWCNDFFFCCCYTNQVRFVIMGNLFCSVHHIHRRFDLKGSSLGRITDKPQTEIDQYTTLKDLDLNFIFRLKKQWFHEFKRCSYCLVFYIWCLISDFINHGICLSIMSIKMLQMFKQASGQGLWVPWAGENYGLQSSCWRTFQR